MKRTEAIRPGDAVKALSLWEPRAALMAIGAKTYETRTWRTRYRGPLLICASARIVRSEMRRLFEKESFRLALRDEPVSPGHAVALVWLEGCRRAEDVAREINQDEVEFGDFAAGRWAWKTAELRRIEPFPVLGARGLFTVTMPGFASSHWIGTTRERIAK